MIDDLDGYIEDLKMSIKDLKGSAPNNMPITTRWKYFREKAILYEGLYKMSERRLKRIKKKYNIK